MELQQDEGLAYLFISHDMAVVGKMSHRVAVLHLGQVVELGERRAVFDSPQRPERVLMQVDILSPIRKVGNEPEHLPLVQVANGHFVAQEEGNAERLAS